MQLCLQNRGPNGDRSQVIAMGGKSRRKQDRRRPRCLQRCGRKRIRQCTAFPVHSSEQRRGRSRAMGRDPPGNNVPLLGSSRGSQILVGSERSRSQGGHARKASMHIHRVRDNNKGPLPSCERLQGRVEFRHLCRLRSWHRARGGRGNTAKMHCPRRTGDACVRSPASSSVSPSRCLKPGTRARRRNCPGNSDN